VIYKRRRHTNPALARIGRWGIGGTALLSVLALAGFMLPWQEWAVARAQTMLTAALHQPVQFRLAAWGLTSSVLEAVQIGAMAEPSGAPPLTLRRVVLHYTPRDIWAGKFSNVQLDGLSLTATATASGWVVSGLPSLPPAHDDAAHNNAAPAAAGIPFTAAAVAALPLPPLTITASTLQLQGPNWQGTVPFTLAWQPPPRARLTLDMTQPQLRSAAGSAAAATAHIMLQHVPAQQAWQGEWRLTNVGITLPSQTLPPLTGQGTLLVDAKTFTGRGVLQDTSKAWRLQGGLTRSHTGAAEIALQQLTLPWLGGRVAVQPLTLRWPLTKPQRVTLTLQRVALGPMLQQLAGEAARAEGSVSGTLHLTYPPQGALRLDDAALQADAPGTIALPPTVLPGEQTHIALVRDILQDLHYELLTLSVLPTADHTLAARLALSGYNPAVKNGKPVKLNITLSGDVLPLLQNNLMLLNLSETLMAPPHDTRKP
jgi:hypothetical protein